VDTMHRRSMALVAIVGTVVAVGAVAFAATRHSPQCRGSATYGVGFARCGGLSTPTKAPHNRPGYAEYTYEAQSVPPECEAPTVATSVHGSTARLCLFAGSSTNTTLVPTASACVPFTPSHCSRAQMAATIERVYEQIGATPAEASCAAPIAARAQTHELSTTETLAATDKCFGGSQARVRTLTNNLKRYFIEHVGIGP